LLPELSVSSFSETIEKAEKSIKEALELFFDVCDEIGRLDNVFVEAEFNKNVNEWFLRNPLKIIDTSLYWSKKIMTYAQNCIYSFEIKSEIDMPKQKIDEKYLAALKLMNYNVEDALADFIILNLSEKISEFNNECEIFERKYNIDFNSFEKKIIKKKNEENFEEEEDYMAWRFAVESRNFFKAKLGELV
jgi:hypothetical protein